MSRPQQRSWPAFWGRIALFFLLLPLLFVTAGCQDDQVRTTGTVLSIEAPGVSIPEDMDGLRVTVVGSSTEDAALCEPTVLPDFDLDLAGDLPIQIYVERGIVYTAWIAYRVEGLLGDDVVIREEIESDWSANSVVFLDPGCLSSSCEPELEHCSAGMCADAPRPGVFDDPSLIEPDAPECFEPF